MERFKNNRRREEMECPVCGTSNPPGEDYCDNCGAALNQPLGMIRQLPTTEPTPTGTDVTMSDTTLSGSGDTGGYRTLAPNARLQNGRYVIENVLGQGGMGAALVAKDTRVSNKLVVIKELISDSTNPQQRQDDVRNFEREVETLSKIEHPLVPNVTDYFTEGTHSYMVQAYVAGENLEDRLERLKGPLPEQEVLTYASQILDVLDYLRQQTPPIVHRDIKPANIIIGSKDKRAHLVDFGIARADFAKNVKRKQTAALGTQGYAPPEQYQGNADGRSDLYALAATLHHLLTNRDPREYPPFSFPPVRSFNKQLSPQIERVLTKALTLDINQRYQNAAAMKHDLDDILLRRFHTQDTTSNYTLGTSGSIAAVGTPNPVGGSRQTPNSVSQPSRLQAQPSYTAPAPQPTPYRQQQTYTQPGVYATPAVPQRPKPRSNNSWMLNSFLLLLVVVLIAATLFVLPSLLSRSSSSGGGSPSVPLPANGIGAIQVNGESIGISDGTVAFDTSRPDGDLKAQAAQRLAGGDKSGAVSLWHVALAQPNESNDAEALIYLEDQQVLSSGLPHITLVVGTMLTGSDVGIGRVDLQGAYVAQKEFNANNGAQLGGVLVYLLVANSGKDAANATTVAQQIVLAANKDKTIVGVMGWPFSSRAVDAVGTLSGARIPMVSQAASTNDLTGISPYFFRVVPPDNVQGAIGAQYAQNTLGAKNVALFEDQADAYSRSLADAFRAKFKGNIFDTETYTKGNQQTLSDGLKNALSKGTGPDLIYFAGYATDAAVLLSTLPTYTKYPNLRVLGGDALYELTYPASARAGFSRLHLTSFAYPDEWDVQGLAARKPAFFTNYANDFDPSRAHQGSPYDYTRPQADAMLSYDATLVMITATQHALVGGKTSLTPTQLRQALAAISGLQGVTGQITFGPDGNPVDKAVVILYVDSDGHIKIEPNGVQGKFLV
ncbi:MAG: ABC transporter substrate-binding protein [Ktedonobacteraceae bacterium]|nr:ABC transporter substrate-binding protein [Ktedonobacteraceae bacterium]